VPLKRAPFGGSDTSVTRSVPALKELSMTAPHAGETTKLLRTALRAPSDTTEVSSESGRRMQIIREPEAGIELQLLERDAAGADTGFMVLSVRSAATRPAAYPSALPFVPHTRAVVVVSPARASVTWPSSQVALDALAAMEPLRAFKEVGEHLKPLMSRLQGETAVDRAALTAEARAEVEALDSSVQDELRAVWESTRPEPSVVAELESVYAAVTEASEADGWERGDSTESDFPFRLRTVQFRRGEDTRAVSMMAMTAVASMVLLMQPPPGAGVAT
jgi:hypothetical protein